MIIFQDSTQGWQIKPVSDPEQAMPGLIIYRFMHNMYYANIQVLSEEVADLIKGANPPLSWFCIDVAAVNDVDFTAAETLRTLHDTLATQGIRLVFSEVTEDVQVDFDKSKLTELFGRDAFYSTCTAVVRAYVQRFCQNCGNAHSG
jgi:MFS superfamily sulfate permease-like transporter